jgi:hypothetical protein
MKAKKHLNLRIPLWWPSGLGWRRLARWLLPTPGNIFFTLLVVGGLLWATSASAPPLRAPALAGDSTTTISYQGRLDQRLALCYNSGKLEYIRLFEVKPCQ